MGQRPKEVAALPQPSLPTPPEARRDRQGRAPVCHPIIHHTCHLRGGGVVFSPKLKPPPPPGLPSRPALVAHPQAVWARPRWSARRPLAWGWRLCLRPWRGEPLHAPGGKRFARLYFWTPISPDPKVCSNPRHHLVKDQGRGPNLYKMVTLALPRSPGNGPRLSEM